MSFLLRWFAKPLLDVVILVAMAIIFGRPRYFRLLLGAVGVAVLFAMYHAAPQEFIGDLFVVVLYLLAGVVLLVFGRVKWKRAALLSLGFCLLHGVIEWIW